MGTTDRLREGGAMTHAPYTPELRSIPLTFMDCLDYDFVFNRDHQDGARICNFGKPIRIYLFGKPALCCDLCNCAMCPRGFP